MKKACDNINWDFLLYLFGRCGIWERWYSRIRYCVLVARLLILVNGSPADFFNSSCSLRYGDLLALLLFVIVLEALDRMMSTMILNGFMAEFLVGETVHY